MNVAYAEVTGPPQNGLLGFFESLYDVLITSVIPLLIAVATLVFIYGIIKYLTAGGDEDKASEGRRMMVFGLIALAVMISMWGLVALLVQTSGVPSTPVPHSFEEFQL